ncbi:hif1an [Scenedesmus sp. PABB004]|nr:hif1an [Scenedesmus sp. PABB004]
MAAAAAPGRCRGPSLTPGRTARSVLCRSSGRQQRPQQQQQRAPPPAVRPLAPPPEPLDPATGFVRNEASLSQVPPELRPLLDRMAAAYAAALGPRRLVGVYLRGSLPLGRFLRGVSDADTVAVALPPGPGDARDRAALAAAAGGAAAALRAEALALGLTKLEATVLQAAPGSAAAAALAAHAAAASVAPAPAPGGAALPPLGVALLPGVPCAFMLKTQAVTLRGIDLPSLLPPAAALPPGPMLLPALAEDLDAARRAADEAAAAGDADRQVSAACWSLKRLVRGAFELAQPSARVWTRDLFWAAHHAGAHLPQLAGQLDAALELYVALQAARQQQGAAAHAGAAGPRGAAGDELAALLARAWTVADALQPRLETFFLKAMLAEEPGWLTKHTGHPIPGGSGGGAAEQAAPAAWDALRRGMQRLLGAAAPAREPRQLLGAAPPPALLAVWGAAAECDWAEPAERRAACAAMRTVLAGPGAGAGGSPSAQLFEAAGMGPAAERAAATAADPLLREELGTLLSALRAAPHEQPLVLRGVAAAWPAAARDGGWGLGWLAAQPGFVGRVRVAPSLQFPFVQPQLVELLARIAGGPAAAPSWEVNMPAREFVARLQPGCRLPRVVWRPPAPAEHHYLQAALPAGLLSEQLPLHELLAGLADRGGGPAFAQAPRLWVSPAGAVSPLHYDASHSFLLQLRGVKRVLLLSPEQRHRLYPYPEPHLLRRRARVNSAARPDAARFPLAAGAGALEAVLLPGDCLFFPAGWAHHTESLGEGGGDGGPAGCCVSVTWRLADGAARAAASVSAVEQVSNTDGGCAACGNTRLRSFAPAAADTKPAPHNVCPDMAEVLGLSVGELAKRLSMTFCLDGFEGDGFEGTDGKGGFVGFAFAGAMLDHLDADGNGKLSCAEYANAFADKAYRPGVRLRKPRCKMSKYGNQILARINNGPKR